MEDQLEQAQLELLQSGKIAQDKTVDILNINTKLKCVELAIKTVEIMNHDGSMSYLAIHENIDEAYRAIAKSVGINLE